MKETGMLSEPEPVVSPALVEWLTQEEPEQRFALTAMSMLDPICMTIPQELRSPWLAQMEGERLLWLAHHVGEELELAGLWRWRVSLAGRMAQPAYRRWRLQAVKRDWATGVWMLWLEGGGYFLADVWDVRLADGRAWNVDVNRSNSHDR